MASSDWSIPKRERELRSSADTDLTVLAVADNASRLLAEVIEQINIPAARRDSGASEYRLHALWFMAIIALRAQRAAMQALRTGYEDQAVGYQRLVDELHNRAQKVRDDASGEYAREWLNGRSLGKGAKMAGRDLWDFLSGPVHANVRAVLDWIAISHSEGTTSVVVGPERRVGLANASLAYLAGEGRDIAVMLAVEGGISVDIDGLDAEIQDAHAVWIPDSHDPPTAS